MNYLVKYLLLMGNELLYIGVLCRLQLYTLFCFAWSNDKMFSLDRAISKSVYSVSIKTLKAGLWGLLILDPIFPDGITVT